MQLKSLDENASFKLQSEIIEFNSIQQTTLALRLTFKKLFWVIAFHKNDAPGEFQD